MEGLFSDTAIIWLCKYSDSNEFCRILFLIESSSLFQSDTKFLAVSSMIVQTCNFQFYLYVY